MKKEKLSHALSGGEIGGEGERRVEGWGRDKQFAK